MTTTTIEPRKERKDTRSADFPKYPAGEHHGLSVLAAKMAERCPEHREDWLQMSHNHNLSAVEAEAKTTSGYEERREALAEILKTVEKDGLKGPRDLDVALDAIEALFDVSTP